jgi:hypothetical protein
MARPKKKIDSVNCTRSASVASAVASRGSDGRYMSTASGVMALPQASITARRAKLTALPRCMGMEGTDAVIGKFRVRHPPR